MEAGIARACITPPPRTPLEGWFRRDTEAPYAEGVHDDLFARALFLRDGPEEALLVAFDLLFFSRENAERLKAALGRALDLRPRQILLNASHTHDGPAVSRYCYHDAVVPDWAYLDRIEAQALAAAREAKDRAEAVALRAGIAHTRLPMSRRRPEPNGAISFRPYPEGDVLDEAPFCLFEAADGRAVAFLFSAACHPSTVMSALVSADYPGVACARLDAHFGRNISLFLQGAGGDAKAAVIAQLKGEGAPRWGRGEWADIETAGTLLAGELLAALDGGVSPIVPRLATALTEAVLPLGPLPDRAALESWLDAKHPPRRDWARRQLERLDRGLGLARSASILVQGVMLGEGLRLVALEGEPVAAIGRRVRNAWPVGVTFALGYSNGMGLYLPTSAMLREGGYEADSYWEYGTAAPLAEGLEAALDGALEALKESGIA